MLLGVTSILHVNNALPLCVTTMCDIVVGSAIPPFPSKAEQDCPSITTAALFAYATGVSIIRAITGNITAGTIMANTCIFCIILTLTGEVTIKGLPSKTGNLCLKMACFRQFSRF